MSANACELADHAKPRGPLAELIRTGARQLVHLAVEIELQERLAGLEDRRLEDGRAGVVQGGYLPEREIRTGIGPITVRMPGIRSRTGEPAAFRSGR